ncbi:MAG: hypothetical protein OJF47_002840 [Nitrospira sp.]|jgi:hypothetical protein|nr:MAG: hypothetical protein OJF47_002840 [Nitrospira sp.]
MAALLDRQSGERYFVQHLLEADVAANNGNRRQARQDYVDLGTQQVRT